jgi:mannitol-specific phosphotransferase system IIBC component
LFSLFTTGVGGCSLACRETLWLGEGVGIVVFWVFKADLSTNTPCVSHFQGNLHDSRYFPYVVMK